MSEFEKLYLLADRIDASVGPRERERILKKLERDTIATKTISEILQNSEKGNQLRRDAEAFTQLYEKLSEMERALCLDLLESAVLAMIIPKGGSRYRKKIAEQAKALKNSRDRLLQLLLREETPAGALDNERNEADWIENIREFLEKIGFPQASESMAKFRRDLYNRLIPLFEKKPELLKEIQTDPEGFDSFASELYEKIKEK